MRHSSPALLLALAVMATPASRCMAIPLPVVNPGFEDTAGSVSNFNEFTFGALPGWEVYDDPSGLIGNGAGEPFYVGTLRPSPDPENPGEFINFRDGAAEGERVAIAFNRVGSDGQGEYGLQQTLTGTPLGPNRTYTLQVEVGNIATGVALSGVNFNLDGFPGYRIDLLAGDEVVATDDSLLSGSIPEGEFATSLVQLTTGATGEGVGLDLGIRLVNLNELDPLFPSANLEVDFDDVRLEVVPAIDGDFNFDGIVNAADYTAWRDDAGTTLSNAYYVAWTNHYGNSAAIAAATMVPEPSAGLLVVVIGAAVGARRRSPVW